MEVEYLSVKLEGEVAKAVKDCLLVVKPNVEKVSRKGWMQLAFAGLLGQTWRRDTCTSTLCVIHSSEKMHQAEELANYRRLITSLT